MCGEEREKKIQRNNNFDNSESLYNITTMENQPIPRVALNWSYYYKTLDAFVQNFPL